MSEKKCGPTVIKEIHFTLKFNYINKIFQQNPYTESTMGRKTPGLRATIPNNT
jgi:hypothetical protein